MTTEIKIDPACEFKVALWMAKDPRKAEAYTYTMARYYNNPKMHERAIRTLRKIKRLTQTQLHPRAYIQIFRKLFIKKRNDIAV